MFYKHNNNYTVESVTSGHPDKICDQISDAILDAYLKQDPKSRVAVETFGGHGRLVIGGEVTSKGKVDYVKLAREIYKDIGYPDKLEISAHIVTQSPDIAMGVDTGGAGDQGCLKKDTLVRTKRGLIPIQEVKAGDYVATLDGWHKVLKAMMTGKKKIVELVSNDGMALECTPDHKILCYDRNGTTYWKEAALLQKNDFMCILKPQETATDSFVQSQVPREKFFSKYNHKIFGPEELIFNHDIAYITGELIGDGYVASPYLMDLAFGNNREHAVLVQDVCNKFMPEQWRLIDNGSSVCLKIDSVLVRKHFENFGITYAKAPRKETPRAVFISPPEVIKSYLRGLFDSDGTIVLNTGRKKGNVRIRLGSSSLRLLRETQLLLHDFGIKSTIVLNTAKGMPVGKKGKFGKTYYSQHQHYVLSLVGFESYQKFCNEISFNDKRKQERAKMYLANCRTQQKNSRGIYLIPHPRKNELIDESRLGYTLPFAVSMFKMIIDKEEIAEVYDLEVEGIHMFSANGIMVHNSMYGFATDETPEYLPKGVVLAHKLAKSLEEARKKGKIKWLRPDGKTQVTYTNGKLHTVLVSAQHSKEVTHEQIKKEITEKIILPLLSKEERKRACPVRDREGSQRVSSSNGIKILVNPTGKFIQGGFEADTGLTGRKIMVDTYGGIIPHGGGCFSGKDSTKVDRSGAYMARFVAKNLVANGYGKEVFVSVAYAIGLAEPLMIEAINEKGENLASVVRKNFDFKPLSIIKNLNLRKPIFQQTAAYGHFGNKNLPWEKIISKVI